MVVPLFIVYIYIIDNDSLISNQYFLYNMGYNYSSASPSSKSPITAFEKATVPFVFPFFP